MTDSKWFWRALTVLALGAGIGTFIYWVKTKPEPAKADRGAEGALVEVTEVSAVSDRVKVVASGTVVAARRAAMSPEVGGRLVWLNPDLVPGGAIKAGTQIARLDPRDYNLAVAQRGATVDQAETALAVERSRKTIAEREWELLGEQQPASELALRDPQMRTAQAAVKAAESGLEQAKLAVGKTVLRAPFNAVVQQKNMDVGQIVGPQTPVVTLVGSDAFWVQVSIPLDRLRWIDVPGVRGATEGSDAWVIQEVGSDVITRKGKVIQLLGDLDPVGRLARVLVEIEDPLGMRAGNGDKGGKPGKRKASNARAGEGEAEGEAGDGAHTDSRRRDSGLPLLLNAYVSVEIDGHEVADVIEVPRRALHDGDSMFVMTDEGTLDIRTVDVLWRRRHSVLVRSGSPDAAEDDAGGGARVALRPGERVVVSPLGAPVQGMKLRLVDDVRQSDSAARADGGDDE